MNRNDLSFPFVYGAQYYRAPTPEREYWARDLEQMKLLGFNTVKYWVQWRWSERRPGVYFWEDLDELMHLAEKNKLHVILNLICDVMPVWAETLYPDCRMVDRNGCPVPTEAMVCRSIGGYPGPCCNHPEMKKLRQNFFRAALIHFRNFPALLAWDVWNEPEHHLGRRAAENDDHLLCYCPNCAREFREAMRRRYGSIDALNRRWGRCYSSFDELELPRNAMTFADFIDWREFQLDVLTGEAQWRLSMVREVSPGTFPHLHVVPHTIRCFNAVNCVDDFALAKECEIFGSTMMNDPFFSASACSAAGNRLLYNAEWHINFGSGAMHPRRIDRTTFFREALPQLAWNVRGILYWQFRPESLGFESPAWGLIRGDGTEKPVARHAEEFIRKLRKFLPDLMRSRSPDAAVGILKSVRNELFFQAFPQNKGNWLFRSLQGWLKVLFELGIPFRFLSDEQLERREWKNVCRVLILPAAYCLSKGEAESADAFLREGGLVIAEGSVGGYSYDAGRHSPVLPGCGLAERWNIREMESVSTFHLDCSDPEDAAESGATGDTAKALSSVRSRGGEYVPLQTPWGTGYGALNLSFLEAPDSEILASACGGNCVVKKRIGKGELVYAGTYLGTAAYEKSEIFLRQLLEQLFLSRKIRSVKENGGYLTPLLAEGKTRFFVAENRSDTSVPVYLPCRCLDVFQEEEGESFTLLPHSASLFAVLENGQ